MTIRFIGDVHGRFKPYKRLIRDVPRSIQLGDMGVGFRSFGGWQDGHAMANPPYDAMARGDHRFIRGNHDNPAVCRRQSRWIADGTVEGDMMFVGGALSVDRRFRHEGYDWWEDEELSPAELDEIVALYRAARPRVMITHDCPETIAPRMEALALRGKLAAPSRTRRALARCLDAHQPDIWLFGHWHHSFDAVIDGVRFICLAELEHLDLDV